MERQLLLEQVHRLKQEGKSIRTIAAQLSVHPSRVQRALKSLGQRTTPLNPRSPLSRSEDGAFVGRQREMAELQAALDGALSGQGRMSIMRQILSQQPIQGGVKNIKPN